MSGARLPIAAAAQHHVVELAPLGRIERVAMVAVAAAVDDAAARVDVIRITRPRRARRTALDAARVIDTQARIALAALKAAAGVNLAPTLATTTAAAAQRKIWR